MKCCRLYFSLGAWLFLLPMAGGQEILQPSSEPPSRTVLAPQPFVGDSPSLSTSSPPSAEEIDLEIQTPPGSRVSIPIALRSKSDKEGGIHRFKLPLSQESPEILVEGPFGGRIDARLRLGKQTHQRLKIPEGPIEAPSSNPDPAGLDRLPSLCPRLVAASKKETEERFVYDGKQDWMVSSKSGGEVLYLKQVRLSFDFEDPSILLGINPRTGDWIFDQRGGYYSNIHYAVFPYSPALEAFLKKLEPDLLTLRGLEKQLRENDFSTQDLGEIQQKFRRLIRSLHGRGKYLGPYQILMHLVFGTLGSTSQASRGGTLGTPLSHGFLPGPYLGSTHWNYSLCEWGDTAGQRFPQTLRYRNFPLWSWGVETGASKRIIVLLEGDDQMKKSSTRLSLEKEGVLRSFDYADDLIGFFVVDREETLSGKTLSTPFDFLSLQVKTEPMDH